MSIHTDPNAAHATYAPSSAHRWTVCTASAQGIAALGEQEEGEEAAEGTRAHDEIERVLGACSGKEVQPHEVADWSQQLDAEHDAAYGVALLLKYVAGLPPGKLWIEQRVALTDQIWGRCDVAHWDAESATLTIVDYKNGIVGVDAEENEQLRIYAAASIYTHKLQAKWIRLVVVQPQDFRPVPMVKQWVESAESLLEWATKVAAIPRGPLTFVAGENCTYCPLFGRCEASRDVLTQLSVMLANTPDAVPAAQVALFKACQKPIADWFKALDKAQLKVALKGEPAPGMAVVTSTTHRAWLDEAAAKAFVYKEKGLDGLVAPSPAQAEEMGIDITGMAKAPPGGPVLAFAGDKRKSWTGGKSAAEMFAGVAGMVK